MMMFGDDTGLFHHFQIKDPTLNLPKGTRLHTVDENGDKSTWMKQGFYAMEYIYADTVLLM